MAKSKRSPKRPPWKKTNPRKARGKSSKSLSASEKASAKSSAKRAGRPYPNLVDNMRVAAKKKRKVAKRKTTKRKTTKHKSAKKRK